MELAIDVSGDRDFKFRFVRINELVKANIGADIANHYEFLQKKLIYFLITDKFSLKGKVKVSLDMKFSLLAFLCW